MIWKLVTLLVVSGSAFAYRLEEASFDEKVKRASVVLIGSVEVVQPYDNTLQAAYAQVRVESVLKGSAPTTILIETRGLVAEWSVNVVEGRRYLFLLTKPKDLYISVNGRFGVIPVDGKPLHLN